jgi:cell division protein FtsZ
VTVVATGLGQPAVAKQPKPQLVVSQKTGTDNIPVLGTAAIVAEMGAAMSEGAPNVFRRRDRASTVEALTNSGVDKYDIPAFLRKQAD